MATIKTEISHNIILPSGKKISLCNVKTIDANYPLSANFKLWEFANNQATESIKMLLNDTFAEDVRRYQLLRNEYGNPIHINSGYRTKTFNAKVNGSSNSLHLLNEAIDASFSKHPKITDKFAYEIESIWKAICEADNCVGGMNIYGTYLHLDAHEDYFGNTKFVVRDKR